MHYAKYKRGAVGHMLRHYDRTAAGHTSEIDVNRSFDNYNLCTGAGTGLERLRACVGVGGNKGWAKCQQRSDVNALCDWVVTMPKDLPPEYEERFFKAAYNYLANRFGVENGKNIVSAFVHKDEVTPHMHFAFVPVVADKRKNRYKVSAKEAVTLADLRSIHKNMQEYLCEKLGVQVNLLNGATKDGNKLVKELKAETAAKVSAAKEAAAAVEEIVASVDRRAAFVPASTPSVLARLFGAKTEPAKVELSPAAYKKLRETAKNGAESCVKLTQARDNTELVQMLNEEVSELRQQFNDEVCQLRQQLREKDQMIEQLLKIESQYKRIEKKLGREQLAKILYASQLQEQKKPIQPKSHTKIRGSSDYSR